MKFISDYLAHNSRTYPQKTAIVYSNKRLSWKRLEEQVAGFSEFLKRHLKGKYKVIAIFLPNSLYFVVSHLAILYLKHISCPLDPQYKEVELRAIIDGLKPDLIITNKKQGKVLRGVKGINRRLIFVEDIKIKNRELKQLNGDPKKIPATLLFTSGTTGKPKATLYSHFSHLWNVQILSKLWKWTAEDTMLLSLPLSHWHGLVIGLTGAIYNGNTIYLEEKFDTEKTLEVLSSGKIFLFMHVPSAYLKLVNYPNPQKFNLKKVRLFVSSSSYLPPTVWRDFYSRYKQKILERYGSSETGTICSNLYDKRVPGCVGRPLPGVKIKFLGGKNKGEIAVKSPGNFLGYYKDKKSTQGKFTKDGFLKTGDIGTIRKGRVYLRGRTQEKIKKSGYALYPRDIEWVINKCPWVADSYVLGIQTKFISDKLIYFIVSRGKINREDIIEYSEDNMPKYWLPDKIIFLKEIPRTKAGKPKIKELQKYLKHNN